jgi:hypothetical protein
VAHVRALRERRPVRWTAAVLAADTLIGRTESRVRGRLGAAGRSDSSSQAAAVASGRGLARESAVLVRRAQPAAHSIVRRPGRCIRTCARPLFHLAPPNSSC